MQHYFAVLEPAASGALHITFPGLDGVGSFAERHTDIMQQASDALESALMVGRGLPLSIEEGARVPLNLAGYHNPLVVVIPFAAPPPKATGHAPARRRTRSRRVEQSTRPGRPPRSRPSLARWHHPDGPLEPSRSGARKNASGRCSADPGLASCLWRSTGRVRAFAGSRRRRGRQRQVELNAQAIMQGMAQARRRAEQLARAGR